MSLNSNLKIKYVVDLLRTFFFCLHQKGYHHKTMAKKLCICTPQAGWTRQE
jgi:hypothetical protein